MQLVIDGYNLIHHVPELAMAEATGQGADALATALNLYRRKKAHKITLVLDGGPEPDGGRQALHGVPTLFSGHARSADDVIADLAARHGPGLTVVTSDRDLARRCQAHDAQVVASGRFAALLMGCVLGPGDAAEDEDDGGWDFSTRKKGPAARAPKRLRRRKSVLDKL